MRENREHDVAYWFGGVGAVGVKCTNGATVGHVSRETFADIRYEREKVRADGDCKAQ